MSAISSATSSPDLFSVLQQLNGQDTTNSATPSSVISTSSDPSDSTQAAPSGHHHHHHGGGVSSKIESAVTSALQNAQPGEDPNQVVQNAIASALKDSNGTNADGTSNPSSTNASSATDASTQTGSTSQSNFESLLKSFNIDPQQFKQDFQSALQGVQQGGNVDFSTLFQSFPPGSAVNTVA